jgi:hypothetical protein
VTWIFAPSFPRQQLAALLKAADPFICQSLSNHVKNRKRKTEVKKETN